MTSEATLPPSATGALIAGRYRVVAPLGRGGFGVVLRACDLATGGDVALKLVLAEVLRHPSALARFHREADLARRLTHPNTVRLLDFGVAEGGRPFIAWELLRGRPLDTVIAGGPLAPARVARIAAQILGSLTEAHALGIVHRDIKPANIFLGDDGRGGELVKVLDFGIAKVVAPGGVVASDPNGQPLTREGEVPGTPAYMALEQLMGGELTPSVDLYAVGLLMAEALSGRRVYDGTGMETLRALLGPDPAPLPPGVQESPLGPVIARATRKPVAERWPSAEAMLDAIVRIALPAPSSRDRGPSARGGEISSSAGGLRPYPVSNTAAHADTGVAGSVASAAAAASPSPAALSLRDVANHEHSVLSGRSASGLRAHGAPGRRRARGCGAPGGLAGERADDDGGRETPPRRRGLVAALVAGAAALAGGGVAVGLAWNAPWEGDAASSSSTKPARTVGRAPSGNDSLAKLEVPGALAAILAREGWKAMMPPTTNQAQGAGLTMLTVEKGSKSATVMLHHMADERAAMTTTLTMIVAGQQCKSSGVFALCIVGADDAKTGNQLLATLTR